MLKPKTKKRVDSIIVVEGKTDTARLKKLFDVDTIETNGSALNVKIINQIIHASKNREIILFLDPDGPGESIRKKLQSKIKCYKQAFIKKTDIDPGSKKIGIAEASDKSIVKALEKAIVFKNKQESISWADYSEFELNSKEKRKIITNYFEISECNNKQLFTRLNLMGISKEKLQKIFRK